MPPSAPEPTPLPSATVQSHCPDCKTRLVLHRIIPGKSELEYWSMRCTKCGHIHQDTVHAGLRQQP